MYNRRELRSYLKGPDISHTQVAVFSFVSECGPSQPQLPASRTSRSFQLHGSTWEVGYSSGKRNLSASAEGKRRNLSAHKNALRRKTRGLRALRHHNTSTAGAFFNSDHRMHSPIGPSPQFPDMNLTNLEGKLRFDTTKPYVYFTPLLTRGDGRSSSRRAYRIGEVWRRDLARAGLRSATRSLVCGTDPK